MPGIEIHAQLIENLADASSLRRPSWAAGVELALFVACGLAMWHVTPRWRPRHAAQLALACVLLPAAAAYAAFRTQGLLFDATPSLYLLLLFGVLLVATLTDVARRRRALERDLHSQREREAFATGELAAARRIQKGMLPAAATLGGDARIELAATMSPAREVGGDLYDFFLLDERRLYFMVGDVTGKGVAASLFMVLAKSLCKSIALRAPAASAGALVSAANVEIARDNAEALLVTAFVGILDLESGQLDHCNAGHDNPIVLDPDGAAPAPLREGDGPPLCALEGFAYRGAQHALQRGALLCLVSDGVTEARNAAGELYGSARLTDTLARLQRAGVGAQALLDALQADVSAFVGGAEPADDLTVLALRWIGPAAT